MSLSVGRRQRKQNAVEILDVVLQRSVVVALAITGALLATLGSALLRKGSQINPRIGRFVLRLGYAVAWASVAIFVVMGFRGLR